MNLKIYLKHKVIFRIALVLVLMCSTAVQSYTQTSKEYTDADVAALVADIEANAYNEYILTSDGGNYSMSDVDLAGDVVIKAKDGLLKKPLISDFENTGTYRNFFDIQNGPYSLIVQGLEFDGTASELMMGISRVRSENASISIVDCDIHDFTTSNGIVRADKSGVSISVEDCFIYNCKRRLIYLYGNKEVYGDVSVSNTTFANSAGPAAIYYRDTDGVTAAGTNLNVDHCTFYNIPAGAPVIKVGTEMSGTVAVTNSLFVQVADSLSNIDLLDYCYLAGLEKVVTGTNTLETAPVFTNVENNDFSLSNAAMLIDSEGGIAGDQSWYPETSSSNEYAVDEIERLISDITASSHSEYILTTAGGAYDLTSAPDISTTTVLKGADDLAARPILSYTSNTSSSFGILRVRNAAERISVTFENLEFDCSADKGNVVRIDSEIDLLVKNCFIHGNTNSNGSLRINSGGGTVSIENSLLTDCKQRVVCLYTPDAVYGAVNISNSTFSKIAGPVIYYRSSGTVAIGTDVSIDHVTFNEISGTEGVFKFRDMQGVISVKNSIFNAVAGSLDPTFASADYCYVGGFETAPTATNTIETLPVFADASNSNFALTNSAELVAGDLQILGDLTWYDDVYAPKVFAELLKVDETHLSVQFNELVSAETANLVGNYMLSGTFGLTGNPINASMSEDSKSVELEVTDLSTISAGQTVLVTVSNVEDLIGNVIAEDNVASYTYLDEVPPVVMLETQEVNNDPGNTVAVQSSELGLIYLVKDGEAQATLADFNKAIEAGKAAMDSVGSVNTDVLISTQGLLVGTYYAYAVDSYENISLKSDNAVQIIDISVPVVTITAQEINNAKGSAIDASMSEAGTIYLVLEGEAISSLEELEAANGTKGIQGLGETSVAISVEGITPGTYSAVAVDLAGNISAASTEKITVIKYVPSIRYYAVEDAPQLSADMVGANDGDVFVLTTNGGDYALEYWHKITAKITVMADENLTRRPVISNYRESSTYQTFRLYADGASLTLKGIEIDSKNHAVNPVKYMLRVESNIGRYSLVAEDCYFHGALKSTGTIVKTYGGTHADSIIFRDCIFEDSEAISMTGLSTEDSPSWDKLEISNCTFLNIPDAAINIKDQPSVNKAYPISVDHCTFYNTGDSLNSVISTDSMTHVSIRNSIFANSGSKTVANIYGDEVAQSSIDFCNYFESVAPIALGSGLVGTNVWSDDPQFADAPAGNLTLGNQTLYVLGGDGLPLGDLRWADVLGAKVLPEIMALSDSTLLVKFSEWIDTTSAIMPQNYTLSGSAGLTGIAKNVELYNFRSVLITCESFIGHVDKEVVITVSDVEDLKGNKVDAEHNTVIYVVEEMKPVVFANEQTVSNADGEIVLAQTSLASGYVYIILEGEAQGTVDDLNAAVQNLNGAKIAVTAAFVDIEILTFNITPGTYFAYFVDGSGMISEKGDNAITITDGIAPIVSAGIQSVDNANDSFVLVQSSESTGKVYIILDGEPQSKNADFITAVAFKNGAVSNVTEANVDVQLSTKGLTAGIYYAYAIDGKGNISEVGDSPINITDKTSIDIFDLSEINIYTKQQRIVVESDQVILKQVLIYNINGKLLERSSQIMQIFESGIYLPGLYIVSVRSVDNTIRNSKLVIN